MMRRTRGYRAAFEKLSKQSAVLKHNPGAPKGDIFQLLNDLCTMGLDFFIVFLSDRERNEAEKTFLILPLGDTDYPGAYDVAPRPDTKYDRTLPYFPASIPQVRSVNYATIKVMR